MGYLTTITIYNDALGAFESDPENFGKRIFEGMELANRQYKEVSVGFNGYANYISIQPSRHADAETIYLHSGNSVFNLCPYGKDFKELAERSPELAQEFVERAQRIVTDAKATLVQCHENRLKAAQKNKA